MFGASKKEQQPCTGFGFGDCVIIEILKDRNLIPKELALPAVDDVIAVFNDSLLPGAMQVANILNFIDVHTFCANSRSVQRALHFL